MGQKRVEAAADGFDRHGKSLGYLKLSLAPGDSYREPLTGRIYHGSARNVDLAPGATLIESQAQSSSSKHIRPDHSADTRALTGAASGTKLPLPGGRSISKGATEPPAAARSVVASSSSASMRPTPKRAASSSRLRLDVQGARRLDQNSRGQVGAASERSGLPARYRTNPDGLVGEQTDKLRSVSPSSISDRLSSTSSASPELPEHHFLPQSKRTRLWSPDSEDEDRRRPTSVGSRFRTTGA